MYYVYPQNLKYMKKLFYTLLWGFAPLFLTAQITLDNHDQFVIGEYLGYHFVEAAAVSEAVLTEDGENVTWDFSNLSSLQNLPSESVAPSTQPDFNSFPQSTLAAKDIATENVSYYEVNDEALRFWGAISNKIYGAKIYYDDPQDWIQYPMAYGESFSDDFGGIVYTTTEIDRGGTTTVEADAYGTLITPAGTFSNVIRLKTDMIYADSLAGFEIARYIETRYLWHDANNGWPLMTYSYIDAGLNTLETLSYLDVSPVATHSPLAEELGLTVFPNPANDFAQVDFTLEEGATVRVELRDILGRLVWSEAGQEMGAGEQNLALAVGNIVEGTYLLQLWVDDEVVGHQVVIQH